MKNYTHVIWDWNGTLLNDVDWNLACMNQLLTRRGLPPIASLRHYRDIFGFPVRDYYLRAGLDLEREPFEELAQEYIRLYSAGESQWSLFPDAPAVLAGLHNRGLTQVVLSASQRDALAGQAAQAQVAHFFDDLLGLDNIHAASKVAIGRDYMAAKSPEAAVLVGDTAHDAEVALELGVDCVLVAAGHQSLQTLESSGFPVVDSITDVPNLIL